MSLEKPEGVPHLLTAGGGMERRQASQQRADGSYWSDDNSRMGAALSQIGSVQVHKVADIVGDHDAPVGGGVVQECRIRPALLPEIIDAVGINPPLSQLRREGGMDVFVQDEDQRDGGVFPG